MIFLATASGLMMERVRSTAILALRPNKCEETHNCTMSRVPAWERGRRKRAARQYSKSKIEWTPPWVETLARARSRAMLRVRQHALDKTDHIRSPRRGGDPGEQYADRIRAHVGDFKSTIVGQALRELQRDP